MRLRGKVAIVTGGGRGIGRAIAHAMSKEGVAVVAASRSFDQVTEVADELELAGRKALALRVDIRRPSEVDAMIGNTAEAFGGLDILVNNAGVGHRKPLVETTAEEWDEIMDTNLKGMFLCCKSAIPLLAKRGGGVIVNISSGAGKVGIPTLSAYCASKFGVIGLSESLAGEVEEYGIRVYALCPGGVDTEMHRRFFPEDPPYMLLKPEDVAKEVLKLCLPDCRVRSGSAVDVYR